MDNSRAVVIGAGFGGLAAAVRMRLLGFRVTLVEALDQAGGRARVFRRGGFTFDAGPTVITAPHLLDELFLSAGRNPRDYFTLTAIDPFYRIAFNDGRSFDYVADEARLIAQIEQFNPSDVDGYRRLAAHAERIFDVGYQQLADRPFHDLSAMLRVVPDMMRLGSYRSVHGLVAKYIKDPQLRQAFSFEPLLVGGNPFTTTSVYLLIHWLERKWGVHFASGGTGAVVSALLRLLVELDVDVRLSAPVATIDIKGGRTQGVVLESGERLPADVVICNGDPTMTYSRLVGRNHRPSYTDRRLQKVRQSMSLFVGYFGARRGPSTDRLAHHTILLGPRYRELLEDIFERKVLARDFSLYLHAPTRTDPSLAPEGHDTFYVLSPVPNLKAGVDWNTEAEPYFDRILEFIEARALPGLRGRIVERFAMTPQDFATTLRSADGAAFGPEPVLTQSAWFRYHNRAPDIRGLYFVGAGTHPGGGIPGVLNSAKVVESVVRDDFSTPTTASVRHSA